MKHLYTIGEITRKGLLKGRRRKPYKHKATVSKALRPYPCEEVATPHGISKVYSYASIISHNKQWDK